MTVEEKIKFIKNYENASNASTGSKYDSNANVTVKNIATLAAELPKKDTIDLNRAIMYKKLTENYGKEMADQYLKDIENHIIYKHDETNISPYTYSSKEVVNVKYKNNEYLISFEDLYDLLTEQEYKLFDTNEDIDVYGKYPKSLQILDRDGWTTVSRMIKKHRHRKLFAVKSMSGEELIVTDNHPIIISDDSTVTVEASSGLGKKQFINKTYLNWKNNKVFNSLLLDNTKTENITLSESLGYLIGYYLGSGYELSKNNLIILTNNSTIEKTLFNIAINNFFNANIKNNAVYLESSLMYKFITEYLNIKKHSVEDIKNIPNNILETNKEFGLGLVSGLLDSSSTLKRNMIYFKCSSYTLKNQICWLLKDFNYTFIIEDNNGKNDIKILFSPSEKKYISEYLSFYNTLINSTSLDLSLEEKRGWSDISDVEEIKNYNPFLKDGEDFIYDLTTDSHTFICNNMWVHNCCSISMYPFLLHGMKNLSGTSGVPKHADTFCGEFVNLLFDVAAQFAGACLYKDQNILVHAKRDNLYYSMKIKDFIEKFNPTKDLPGHKDWQYSDIKDEEYEIYENEKWVPITKVYKRLYNEDIYKITTKEGRTFYCSKDHKLTVKKGYFKHHTYFEDIAAENLKEGDYLVSTTESFKLDTTTRSYRLGQLVGLIESNKEEKDNDAIRIIFNKNVSPLIIKKFNDSLYLLDIDCEKHETEEQTYFDIEDKEVLLEIKNLIPSKERISQFSFNYLCGLLDGLLATTNKYKNTYKLKTINYMFVFLANYIMKLMGESDPKEYKVDKYTYCFIKKKYYGLLDLSNINLKKNKHVKKYHKIKKIEKIKNDDKYVYEIETESHYYSISGYKCHNCATPEFLTYLDHFLRIDYGQDYIDNLDKIVEIKISGNISLRKKIENFFQQVVYSINQPAAARGSQSIFWNIAYFDEPYFNSIFKGFYFPDGDEPNYKSVKVLQKIFMKWFNAERTKEVLTFPVETFNLLSDGHDNYIDHESANFVAEMLSEGHSFFIYQSDSVDALASCCRLRNAIDSNVFSYTLGAGGIQTGSKGVITINLNRNVQNWKREKDSLRKVTIGENSYLVHLNDKFTVTKENGETVEKTMKEICEDIDKNIADYNIDENELQKYLIKK